MTNVLQDWVSDIPLREQGVLLLALRGPDGFRKEHGTKNIVRALRGCILVQGYTGEPLVPGENLPDDDFMQMYRIGCVEDEPWKDAVVEFFRTWDELNVHFLFHLLHAAEILGVRHPERRIAERWWELYTASCAKAHVNPETVFQLGHRLGTGPKRKQVAYA